MSAKRAAHISHCSGASRLRSKPAPCGSSHHHAAVVRRAKYILHIVVDDLGYYDIGYHNPTILSPHIDGLRNCGVHLDSMYAFKTCAPSRASILTGRYPFHMGIYENADIDTAGVPANFTLLPELLQRAGFATHCVGKWHVGFRTMAMTPTARGFDTFLGTWHCCTSYYEHHFFGDSTVPRPVLALARATRRGAPPQAEYDRSGQYSTEMYANESVRIIQAHDKRRGLYLYLAFQAVHGPYEVPEAYACRYNRRHPRQFIYEGMVTAVDAAVGRVVSATRTAHLWDATLVVVLSQRLNAIVVASTPLKQTGDRVSLLPDQFHSDNGGAVGRNGRLRGGKFGLWEGGVRVTAFLAGPLLSQAQGEHGRTWRGLAHVADLLPTLLTAAGVTLPSAGDASTGPIPLDGVSLWAAILANDTSPRHEVVHTVINSHNRRDCFGSDHDAQNCGAAIRSGPWKLLLGYPGDGRNGYAPNLNASYHKWDLVARYGGRIASSMPRLDGCHILSGEGCQCWRGACLFNVEADPGEEHDESAVRPQIVSLLLKRLAKVSATAAIQRAALCGSARRADELARRRAVQHDHAYLPYSSEALPWRNDATSDLALACHGQVVGESTWWYNGQPPEGAAWVFPESRTGTGTHAD
jgi:arylsulfatase I/J